MKPETKNNIEYKLVPKLVIAAFISLIALFFLMFLSILINIVPNDIRSHTIDIGDIKRFNEPYSYYCYDQLANNDNHIGYEYGKKELVLESLNEIMLDYYSYYDTCSKHENCIEVIERGYLTSINDVSYKITIKNALYSMNRKCSDAEMIKQINKWICDNLEYEITNGDLYRLFDKYNYKGQCYHYARLFQDMCNAVGIDMRTAFGDVNGEGHVWNYCVLNGEVYYFDITWNDAEGEYNKYIFMDNKSFQETHGN